jgi:3-hydroxyisobutyrate dehydrogenase-like beta-hydroxyacid dehydrogenase
MAEEAGFVGLGVMGRAMAGNLARKYGVVGYDVDGSRFEGLTGVARAGSLAELARRSTVVCLSLPDAKIVEQVAIGDGGLVHSLAPGSLVIDLSTSMPAVSRRIAARLAEKRIPFADAPVSGGEAGARTATLAIMVGADAGTFERCKPILSAMGKTVVRVGGPGAGNVAKLVNNMIVASAFAVIAEGFALAAKNDVDLQLLYEAIREGWAGSKVLDISVPAMIKRDYTPGGTINMMEKDLGYARSMASETHVPIPMTAAAHEVFVAGQAAGKGALAQPAVIELWRRERGS